MDKGNYLRYLNKTSDKFRYTNLQARITGIINSTELDEIAIHGGNSYEYTSSKYTCRDFHQLVSNLPEYRGIKLELLPSDSSTMDESGVCAIRLKW